MKLSEFKKRLNFARSCGVSRLQMADFTVEFFPDPLKQAANLNRVQQSAEPHPRIPEQLPVPGEDETPPSMDELRYWSVRGNDMGSGQTPDVSSREAS